MPSLSQSRSRKGVLSANPLVSPSSERKQVNLHHRGSHELTPTNEFANATLHDIHIPLAAVRLVRGVVLSILHRLEHDGDAPPSPLPAEPDPIH